MKRSHSSTDMSDNGSDDCIVDNSDYRLIPICPTAEELFARKRPPIRPNLTIGKYKDIDDYLDIQYRLLREDFIRPLRRDITQYLNGLNGLNGGKCVEEMTNIQIYSDVKFGKECEKSFNKYWMSFDVSNLRHINWKASERLFFGSLVCLSSDDFRSVRFGSITGNRTVENLSNGNFQLSLEGSLIRKIGTELNVLSDDYCPTTDWISDSYVMIESEAYFEAYRHTLKVLQSFRSDNFPLERYIIEANNELLAPTYLKSESVYDFSHLVVDNTITREETFEEVIVISEAGNYSEWHLKSVDNKRVKLMDTKRWPAAEAIGLDESQYEAFQSALTKQLVLIQGPPGTGKTYLGLKIVETLYKNRFKVLDYHSKSKSSLATILIVCYTNHALDQFLEGILKFCTNLIRIGGGSKSEALKPYTLRHGRRSNDRIIYTKNIIGMTTTGAAKHRHIVEQLDAKVVIIEEAAEVLESHVITCLTKNTEHLILIGDHQQLRPQTADFEMSKSYGLDVSLFERLINNGIPFNQLKLQHRMRPEISGLLTPHIYELLFDHKSVYEYENIKGLKKNLFFINHSNTETSSEDRMSKSNRFEADFIVRLARYLIYQNYDKTQITILSLYSSQFFLIKQLIRSDQFFDGVRVEVLDGFQGEENDIILVSFVRSNLQNDIGFLKISNRINVALSRAKKGLYCIGNFDCLSKNCKLWKDISKYLTEIQSIGRELELVCTNHPNKTIMVSEAKDFDCFSFGGCSQPCVESLECGHSCPYKTCHPFAHSEIECKESCLKVSVSCDLGHKCQRKCHIPDECGPCIMKIEKTVPNCEHRITEVCSGDLFCTDLCERGLPCGHVCHKKCGESCQLICRELVERIAPKCGHKVEIECYIKSEDIRCRKDCQKSLICGHKCGLKCNDVCEQNCKLCYSSTKLKCRWVDEPAEHQSIWEC